MRHTSRDTDTLPSLSSRVPLEHTYSFFFRVDVSTDLGGKSAILGAWEENRRKVRRFGRKVRKWRKKEGERTERASAKRWKKSAPQAQKKKVFKSKIHLKSILKRVFFPPAAGYFSIQFVVPTRPVLIFGFF